MHPLPLGYFSNAKSKWGVRCSGKEPCQVRRPQPHGFARYQVGCSPSRAPGYGPAAQGRGGGGTGEEVAVPGWAGEGGTTVRTHWELGKNSSTWKAALL